MNSLSIVFGVLIVLVLLYFLYKIYQTKSLETLLEEKQKEQTVELRKSSYKVQYSYVSLLVLTLFIVIGIGVKPADTIDESRIFTVLKDDLAYKINEQNNGIFLLNVQSEIEVFEYVETSNGEQFINPDNTSVVEGVILEDATIEVYAHVLQVDTSLMINHTIYTENEELDDEGVYLVIGGVVSEDLQGEFNTRIETYNNILYPWNVYLIDGYDPSKSYLEQSDEIKTLILQIIHQYYD